MPHIERPPDAPGRPAGRIRDTWHEEFSWIPKRRRHEREGVTKERMEVWPEERIRGRAAAGGGRLRVPVEELLAEFGARRSTPLARQGIERALREVDLAVEPSLQEADLRSSVTISLTGEANGAPDSAAPPASEMESPPGRTDAHRPVREAGGAPQAASRLDEALTRAEPENRKPGTSVPEASGVQTSASMAQPQPTSSAPVELERDELVRARERLEADRSEAERRLAQIRAEVEAAR